MAFHDAPGPDRVMFCSVGYARGPETRVYMDGSDAGLSRGEVVAALNGWVVDKDTIAELRAHIDKLEAEVSKAKALADHESRMVDVLESAAADRRPTVHEIAAQIMSGMFASPWFGGETKESAVRKAYAAAEALVAEGRRRDGL